MKKIFKKSENDSILLEVKTDSEEVKTNLDLDKLKDLLLSEKIKITDKIRSLPPKKGVENINNTEQNPKDMEIEEWKEIKNFAKDHFSIEVLFSPIKAHRRFGGRIGWVVVGILVGILASIMLIKEWDTNLQLSDWFKIGGLFLLSIVIMGVLNLIPKAGKVLCWFFGILATIYLAAISNFLTLIIPVVFVFGCFAGGFIYGWIPGSIVGLLVGMIRSPSLTKIKSK